MIRSYIGIGILTAAFYGSMYGCVWRDVPTPLGPMDIVIDASTIIGIYSAMYGDDNQFPDSNQKKVMHIPVESVSKNVDPIMNNGEPTVGIVSDDKIKSIRNTGGAWMSESDFKNLYKASLECMPTCEFVTSSGDRIKIERNVIEKAPIKIEDTNPETSNYI